MQLIQLEREDGQRIAVRPRAIAAVVDAEDGTKLFLLGDSAPFVLKLSYDEVVALLRDVPIPP